MKFHDTWFKPNNATLLVVGDTTLAEMKPQLEKLLGGGSRRRAEKKTLPDVAQPAKTAVYLLDRPGALQSVIFGAELAPPRNSRRMPLQLVNDIFGGLFSSRINMNLREDKHWSYGVSGCLRRSDSART